MTTLTHETMTAPAPYEVAVPVLPEREVRHEVQEAVSDINDLMHGIYQARRWGATDQIPGGTHDIDMFAMRLHDGSAIEEIVSRSETMVASNKPGHIDRTYAVDIYADGQRAQQLKLNDEGDIEALTFSYDEQGIGTAVLMSPVEAVDAVIEFRHRVLDARDRVANREHDQANPNAKAEADKDAYYKLMHFVYGGQPPAAALAITPPVGPDAVHQPDLFSRER